MGACIMEEMVIDAQISIIARYENEVVIKVYDKGSSTTFVELTLTHEQFVNAAMNRLSNCDVKKAVVMSLDRIGKTMEHKTLEFELPLYSDSSFESYLRICISILKFCQFNTSFYNNGGKRKCSPSRIRTYNRTVNSRLLYH